MAAPDDLHARLMQRLDDERDYVVDLTRRLVRVRSVNPAFLPAGETSAEAEAQELVAGELEALGMELERWEEAPDRPNVAGRLPGAGGGRGLVLNGHVDVVPEGDPDGWSFDPYGAEIEEGRMYGRGSYDMKGGLAALVAALRALRAEGVELAGDLALHAVVDEESGGAAGSRTAVARAPGADGVIVAEPTQGELIVAEGGLSWLRVTIRGAAAHAGWRYAQIYPQRADGDGSGGVNALEKGVEFIGWLQRLERQWGRSKRHPLLPPGITTMNPGVMHSGVGLGDHGLPRITTNPAMIPDACVIEIDFKYLPTQTFEEAREEFETLLRAWCESDPWLAEHPPRLDWHVRGVDFPPVATPSDHPLVDAVRGARGDLGLDTELVGFVAVTDAAFYAGAGIPAVIYGPTGSGAHGDDEYVVVDSLTEAAKVYAGAILRWCGVV